MYVTIRLFAGYRERVGESSVGLELSAGATVGEMTRSLVRRYGQLPRAQSLVVAVNQEYQDHDYVLTDGDEVALIPPVSGGEHD